MTKTFLNLDPVYNDPKTAKFFVQPIPYEGTVSFLSGAINGPDAILDVSDQMEHIDEELHIEFPKAGIVTLDPLLVMETPDEEMTMIYESVSPLFKKGKLPIFLGGEHSITAPIVRAAFDAYPDLSVLQFDAHADLRDSYSGTKHSHAAVMRRVLEITPKLVQVGIRSFSPEEYEQCHHQIDHAITVPTLERPNGFHWAMEQILNRLSKDVYITFDIDALDPAYAPATGTPEPGGMTWRQATQIIEQVSLAKNVVGADVVEVAPFGNRNVITEFLAARLVAKFMAYNCSVNDYVCNNEP